MSASLGNASAWARKAGSRVSSEAAARSASMKVRSATTALPAPASRAAAQKGRQRQVRKRLPASEMICLMTGQQGEIGQLLVEVQVDGRREAVVDRHDGARRDAIEYGRLRPLR